MKLAVRASVLFLTMAGVAAGIASSHAAKAQTVVGSHLAMNSAMPAPVCEPGSPCKMHGR